MFTIHLNQDTPYNLSSPYSAANDYRMNASDTLAFYRVDDTTFLSIIAKAVFTTVLDFVLKTVLEQAIKRYSNCKRSQLNQFYSDVKVIQEILQETEKNVVGTGDNYTRQLLEKNLDKCQKVCNQIESQFLDILEQLCTICKQARVSYKYDLKHLLSQKSDKAHCQRDQARITSCELEETTAVDYYEVQYDRQTGHGIKVCSTQCLLDSMQLHFPSEKFYNIRVRGVNGCGPGEWSESAVGKFTILPEQPQKPHAVHDNSSAGIALVMEKPLERDGAKPVTHFVVEYHTDEDKKCTKKVFSINNLEALTLEGKEVFKINLNNRSVNTAPTYHVLISHRNEDGDSLPCIDCIETDRITPDVPVGLKVTYWTTEGILIEWSNTNACTVDHYKVHWQLNKHTVNTVVTKNCYASKQFLDSNTSYLIKVRAVNRRSQKSEFTEIRAKTKSDTIGLLKVTVPVMFICTVAQIYMPVLPFYALLVAMIVAFFYISTKHARLIISCLLALGMTGNIIIAVILNLSYPAEFMFYVCAGLGAYTMLFYYREHTQMEHYMLEKHMVSTKLEVKQSIQMTLLMLHVLTPPSTLALIVCLKYFIPMTINTVITTFN